MELQFEPAPCETDMVVIGRLGDHIGLIKFNRPQVRNAVNAEVAAAILKFIEKTEADPKIRVGIITGEGPVFCAGADLKEVSAGRDIRIPRPGGFAGFANTKRTKPWIAALNGPGYGGGAELALACEMIVMAEGSYLALTEVQRGLVPLGGGAIRAPRRLPPSIAYEMLLTGDPLSAERAQMLGLSNRVVKAEEVLDAAISLAERISIASPFGVRTTLRLARTTVDRTIDEMWELNNQALTDLYNAPDFQEGPKAFVEKRKPVWSE